MDTVTDTLQALIEELKMDSEGPSWRCTGCRGLSDGSPTIIYPNADPDKTQRFCGACATKVQLPPDQTVEAVPLSEMGVPIPIPKLTEWPRADTVTCEEEGCELQCCAVQAEKGSNVAHYICEEQHTTTLLASRNDDQWVFEKAPF